MVAQSLATSVILKRSSVTNAAIVRLQFPRSTRLTFIVISINSANVKCFARDLIGSEIRTVIPINSQRSS
jgi:hypothetical protein